MIVVDASVWVAWLVATDEHHADSRAWLSARLRSGRPLATPIFAIAEVAGAIARRSGQPALGHRAAARVISCPVLALYPSNADISDGVAGLAADLRMRGADAVYVALARELGAPLLTLDAEQRIRASRAIDVQTPTTR